MIWDAKNGLDRKWVNINKFGNYLSCNAIDSQYEMVTKLGMRSTVFSMLALLKKILKSVTVLARFDMATNIVK
jgi:hypothetical protein